MGTLGGTTLTVRGSGFRETLGLACDLDGTRREQVVSPTSIVCMAPPTRPVGFTDVAPRRRPYLEMPHRVV